MSVDSTFIILAAERGHAYDLESEYDEHMRDFRHAVRCVCGWECREGVEYESPRHDGPVVYFQPSADTWVVHVIDSLWTQAQP